MAQPRYPEPVSAAAVVLLRPAAGSPTDWSPLATSLGRGGSVITPDLGLRPDRPVILEGPALNALAAITAAGLDTAALCGLGFGAMTALSVAAGFGARVSAVVLSTARTPESTALLSLHHGWQGLLSASTAQRLGASATQVAQLFDQVRPTDYRAWVARVEVPALVLVGDRDVANLGPSTKLAAALPQGRLQIVAHAGADWPRTQPDRYAELVWTYLSTGG